MSDCHAAASDPSPGICVLGPALAAAPERIALRTGDQAFRYRDLDRRARQCAARLAKRGLRPGDRVAILATNHVAHFDLLCAAPLCGVIAVPLNARLTAAELATLVVGVQPALLLVDSEHAELGRTLGPPLLALADHEAWLAAAGDNPATPGHRARPDDLHLLLFTGGTTGTPKAACLPYRQTLGNADDTVSTWGLRAEDIAIQATPMFHAGAQVLSLPLLRCGGSVVLMPRFEPGAYLQLAARHRATLMFMVPTMYASLAEDPAFGSTDLSAVRFAIAGGAPCPAGIRERYIGRGIRFRCGFGMTEAGVNCFAISAEDAERAPLSVGRPLPRIGLSIRHDDGSEAGVDETGELCLSGPQVCAGYWGEAPAGGEFRSGWLHTGDLARRAADGLVSIVGRRKDSYISGGENVHPFEVEAALLSCPGITESCVFGWPDARWGEVGIALVVARPGLAVDDRSLRLALRERLAAYKLPADIRYVAALPRSSVGKLLRGEARDRYAALRQSEDRECAA